MDEAGRLLFPLNAATASGERVSFRSRNRPQAPVDLAHANAKEVSDLLSTPLHHLLREVDEMKSREKALE